MKIPSPAPGLVISYSYLWDREAERGAIEGVKDRPCAIVLTVNHPAIDEAQVTVAPITHSSPPDPTIAIEIPAKVKRLLGMDTDRSWIIAGELNTFVWPGCDLRPAGKHADSCAYGFLPPVLLNRVVELTLELDRLRKLKITSRDE